jgi:hypothetical protein
MTHYNMTCFVRLLHNLGVQNVCLGKSLCILDGSDNLMSEQSHVRCPIQDSVGLPAGYKTSALPLIYLDQYILA